jgi:hypothetical protein
MTCSRMPPPRRGSISSSSFVTSASPISWNPMARGSSSSTYDNDGLHGSLLRQSGTDRWGDAREAGNPAPAQPALPQQRRRDVHRRDREGRARRQRDSPWLPRRPITTATDLWTSMSSMPIGKNILYHNNGDGTFTDVTDKAGVGNVGGMASAPPGWMSTTAAGWTCTWATTSSSIRTIISTTTPTSYPGPLSYKPERDVLYINNGDGTFTNASEAAGIWALPPHRTMSVHPVDFDRNGREDLYICNDATPNMLLINDGHGHFHDEALNAGRCLQRPGRGRRVDDRRNRRLHRRWDPGHPGLAPGIWLAVCGHRAGRLHSIG